MKDLVFTIIAVWVVYKIFSSISASRNSVNSHPKEGQTTINHDAPKKKNRNNNDEGEYVDYEEIK